MIVHDQPDSIDSPEASCPTHPQVTRVTVSQRAAYKVEAMDEGQLTLRSDVQLMHLVADGASACSEEFLPSSTFIVSSCVSQGRIEIE